MGVAAGEAVLVAARLAVLQEAALVVVPASGGARMQEGVLSLMQMPRTIIAADMVKEAGLPYIVLLTDPTTGGVSASFAMVGDITLAEPGAIFGFAGARVIEETIREKLPEGFQRAEYLLDHGMVDLRGAPRGIARRHRPPARAAARSLRPRCRRSAAAYSGGRMTRATLTQRYRAGAPDAPAPEAIDLSLGRIEGLLAASATRRTSCRRSSMSPAPTARVRPSRRLRACLEAGGCRVHVYISPHLVRFHERIRLAGKLIEED